MTTRTLEVMGIQEIAEAAGISRDLAAVWNARGKLPEPDAVINGGRTKVWTTDTITAWLEELR